MSLAMRLALAYTSSGIAHQTFPLGRRAGATPHGYFRSPRRTCLVCPLARASIRAGALRGGQALEGVSKARAPIGLRDEPVNDLCRLHVEPQGPPTLLGKASQRVPASVSQTFSHEAPPCAAPGATRSEDDALRQPSELLPGRDGTGGPGSQAGRDLLGGDGVHAADRRSGRRLRTGPPEAAPG